MNGPTDGGMRIEELAAKSGVAATTIRLYQHKRLLEPPEVVKRVGWYNSEHLICLRQIGRLQEEGFSLGGIARLRAARDAGETLSSLLGEIEQGNPESTQPADDGGRAGGEASDVVGERPLEGDRLERAIALGLVERTRDGELLVRDENLVAAGRAMAGLADLGIPPQVVIADWDRIADATDELAHLLVDRLLAYVIPPAGAGDDDAELIEAVKRLREVRSLSMRAVAASMASSIAVIGADRLGSQIAINPE